ncbi:MFS transporter [Polychaeton citri CBS 116435]|uniref:MFS transporter n=1 Tax=Polychaeton citri CBS 116435 TaxID=1314669 RepID=A0A9P4Q9X0_9PEZI|nr:MFS transporter [Polychaeton citri CBS 116435]
MPEKQHGNERADAAMKAITGETIVELDQATNRRLVRTIDWHILPMLFLVYTLQFLDKLVLSYASIMGIKQDLHMTGTQYSLASSMFYFGYLVWEFPTGRLLQLLPLSKYTGFNIIAWGAVLACTAAARNYSAVLALRFLLGFFEASVTPAFALYTSQWYTKKEQGNRTGVWFSSNGFTQIAGGLLAYGMYRGVDKYGSAIPAWQILFLAIGLFTVVTGIFFIWYMPDNQFGARWLSEEDRILAVVRIRENQQGIGNTKFKWYQLREAFTDPLTWMFFFYSLVHSIPNGGLSGFFSQLIVSFGYTKEQSLLYGTPAGAIGAVALLLNGYLGDKLGSRIFVASFGAIIAIVGMVLIVALPLDNNGGRLAGYYICQTAPMGLVTLLSLISSNVAGYTKKTTVAAMYFVGYCVGNIIGPQTFVATDAPRYIPAEITIICCWGVTLMDLLLIYWYCKRQNNKKAAIRAQPDYIKAENQEFLDLTDRENPEFIYTT